MMGLVPKKKTSTNKRRSTAFDDSVNDQIPGPSGLNQFQEGCEAPIVTNSRQPNPITVSLIKRMGD